MLRHKRLPAPAHAYNPLHTLRTTRLLRGSRRRLLMKSSLMHWLALLTATLLLGGCAPGNGGPPHPGAVNPYSSGGFHDAGPNYPDTGR